MSKSAVVSLIHPDKSTTEIFILKKGETMPDGYPCEKYFSGPALVIRVKGPWGLTSTEYDIDGPKVWAWLGELLQEAADARYVKAKQVA